jgi:hypothetical protein
MGFGVPRSASSFSMMYLKTVVLSRTESTSVSVF